MLADRLQRALRRRTGRPWVVLGPVQIGHYARIGYTFDAPRAGAFLELDAYREISALCPVTTPVLGGAVSTPELCAMEALNRMRQ